MKINSYFIFWDYDTPYSYTNKWKFDRAFGDVGAKKITDKKIIKISWSI